MTKGCPPLGGWCCGCQCWRQVRLRSGESLIQLFQDLLTPLHRAKGCHAHGLLLPIAPLGAEDLHGWGQFSVTRLDLSLFLDNWPSATGHFCSVPTHFLSKVNSTTAPPDSLAREPTALCVQPTDWAQSICDLLHPAAPTGGITIPSHGEETDAQEAP